MSLIYWQLKHGSPGPHKFLIIGKFLDKGGSIILYFMDAANTEGSVYIIITPAQPSLQHNCNHCICWGKRIILYNEM